MLSKRRISITVQLSDPEEYEGGTLQMFRGGNIEGPYIEAEKNAGCVFIFPSYMMHRVTPVTKGTRKSFVLWLGGGHYR
jgi:PKHD-type hydroxylase